MMNSCSSQLSIKRQKYHASIRKSIRVNEFQKHRFKFIIDYTSDLSRLKNIDCYEYIGKIKSSTNFLQIQKQIQGLFVYSVGNQSSHLFSIFDSQVIQKLITIGCETFEAQERFLALRGSIKQIRTKIIWIFFKFFSQKLDRSSSINLYHFFELCISVQSQQNNGIILHTLQPLIFFDDVSYEFLNSKLFEQILIHHGNFSIVDFCLFSRKLFEHLSLLEYIKYSNHIQYLINTLIQKYQQTETQIEETQILMTLLKFFNTEIVENQNIIIQNFNILKLCYTELSSKTNCSKQNQVERQLLIILQVLYRHDFESQSYVQALNYILKQYLEPMSVRLSHKSSQLQFRFFDVLSDACASQGLTYTIIKSSQLMKCMLDYNKSDNQQVFKLATTAIANLVLTVQIPQLKGYKMRILDFITDCIGQDNKIDTELELTKLEALKQFLELQSDTRESIESQNSIVQRFKNRAGVLKLEYLKQITDDDKIDSLASRILKFLSFYR